MGGQAVSFGVASSAVLGDTENLRVGMNCPFITAEGGRKVRREERFGPCRFRSSELHLGVGAKIRLYFGTKCAFTGNAVYVSLSIHVTHHTFPPAGLQTKG